MRGGRKEGRVGVRNLGKGLLVQSLKLNAQVSDFSNGVRTNVVRRQTEPIARN